MPTVFISYSWDDPEHKAWVRRFAGDLRAKGIDAWLDQWELQLGDDVTQFMERGVSQADYVLLVCTENFARKANERHGGVGYEQTIVTSQILNSQPTRGRIVCVLRQGPPSSAIPRYMQARLWVDCRDDATYADAFQQILIHIFGRYEGQKPALTPGITGDDRQAPVMGAAVPQCWVLVAGTGTPRAFSPELEALSRSLGQALMTQRCGLVTGGWPGVDEWVARSFSESAQQSNMALEDALIQVIVKDQEPAFTAGQLVFVDRGYDEWNEPVRRAGVVLLLGGVGGVAETGEVALRVKRPVLPIADSGGDAKDFYLKMLRQWSDLQWMGLSQKEFQQLGRPGVAGVHAAVELALKVGAMGPTA
jgi:predicted Rossmann-fold nucleotide-binding protein